MIEGTGSVPPMTASGGLDRAAHRRTDPEWLAKAWRTARVLMVDNGRVPVEGDPSRLVLVPADQVPEADPSAGDAAGDGAERYFLGEDEEQVAYFAVPGTPVPLPEQARWAGLREIGHLLTERDAALFVTGIAISNWHARHRYSPKTGRPTTPGEGGWTRCTDDGEVMWPRTDPAVIVLVHDGVPGPAGRCLLGHNAAWESPGWGARYSCLAGFVEPGEAAEATVAREVLEEVGVAVGQVRYVASQAWPFPGSLMLGFTAIGDPADPVRVDPAEISEARWFTREEVRAVLDGEQRGFVLPFHISIAHFLIAEWARG